MATILSTTLLNRFLISSFFLILLLSPACKADNVLYTDKSLHANDYLEYGSYQFKMQADCNLVLFDNGRAIWASNTSGQDRNCSCTMQSDRNLVVYAPNGRVIWASNTWTRPRASYVLILQSDRNVVIYGPGVWALGTNIPGSGAIPVVSWASSEDTNHTAVVDGSGTIIDM
ncbi:mannose-specific lectin-like [Magnolia sinica]|uniref:mannose-specific lectin-like n=1 Tax=Magnolia sinica TaxID=86752 RepID=UPI002659E2B9|nr:mannose-specific lectin-like [Magnolia sinica]